MSAAVALGIGAAAGALAVEVVAPLAVLLATVAGALGIMVSRRVRRSGWRGASGGSARGERARGRRVPWLPMAFGACVVALRAMTLANASPASIPEGEGPWIATVV